MADPGGPPRVTFGIIVLNGEPFTRYCLRSIYPFAHEIIAVEGASPHAAAIATKDGHSTDGTLETLRRFKAEEDPEGKLQIVTAEDDGHPDGFWPGEKDEQSRAYARRATGEYLWQVDVDEFYRPADMRQVLRLLADRPGITAVSFDTMTFWGSLDVVADGAYLRSGAREYHRLFKFGPGYAYKTHRPPTVVDPEGRDLRTINWLDGRATGRKGIRLYHYSLLFPRQVREKCAYYHRAFPQVYAQVDEWVQNCFMTLRRPYRVHNIYTHPSWLERYHGEHPPEVIRMMDDIRAGRVREELRPTDDIEALLHSPLYVLGRGALKTSSRLIPPAVLNRGRGWLSRLVHSAASSFRRGAPPSTGATKC
jgi:glycosyltransferase involved in cell wall biosynthesis